MSYLYLAIAIVAEVIGTSSLKASAGFTRLVPSIIVLVGYAVAFFFLSLTLRTIPVGIAGIAFKHAIEGSLRSLWVIAIALIVVGLALAYVERIARRDRSFESITLRDAIIIGCAQALALVPGVSRSGITILAALGLGMRREAAARFSFLLSVPAVAAAGLFELPKVLHARDVSGSALAIGLIAAAISGYASIAWLLRFLRARSTIPFVVYRVALGTLLLVLLGTGRL
jgi:undecaprenyl-diphosphatase